MEKKELKQGVIESYIHSNKKVGVLLDLRCETDFVAKTDEFKTLAHELCLQIAAMGALFIKEEDIPEEFLIGERKIYEEQLIDSGKSKELINKIIDGKIKKYKEEISLLSQSWIKDDSKTIKDLIKNYTEKLGEDISIKRFVRYEI